EPESDAIVGLTISSFVTLSFEPPLVMYAIQRHTASYAPMVTCRSFGVSLLNAAQTEIARHFAKPRRERGTQMPFDIGQSVRVPLIPAALAQIECVTHEVFMSGDHAIVVGLVEAARTSEGEPLLYFGRQYGNFSAFAER
ncbi:MAG: flavin reductase family protein, partial [Proteobacteria bacterium]|nr:flavin reductase family protein [Pseudomonadota bacterium]